MAQLEKLLQDYNSVGITSIVQRSAGESDVTMFQTLKDQGKLTCRTFLCWGVSPDGEWSKVAEQIQKAADHPAHVYDNLLWLRGVKVFLDGGMLTGSAWMQKPWGVSTIYSITDPEYRGVLTQRLLIEQEGTYPLPEAQRDRFLFNVIVDYPSRDEEGEIIDRTTSTMSAKPQPVVSGAEIIEYQQTVRLVPLPEHVKNFVLDLVRSARPKDPTTASWVRDLIDWGPGPRACQQLVLAAKARALLHGRHHVTRDDAEALAFPVLRHRIVPTFNAEAEGVSVDDIIRRLLRELPKASKQLL